MSTIIITQCDKEMGKGDYPQIPTIYPEEWQGKFKYPETYAYEGDIRDSQHFWHKMMREDSNSYFSFSDQ